jgi:glycosyltransferase involved in cell wall biosynthesis
MPETQREFVNVLFDHQIFSQQEEGGISRYFVELVRNILGLGAHTAGISLKFSCNRYLRQSQIGNVTSILPQYRLKGRRRFQLALNKRYSCQRLRRSDFDIFHPTYYDPYFIEELDGKPFVLTVFDLTHDLFPDQFRNEPYFSRWMKETVEASARIIAISENTKSDLVRLYEVKQEKVDVIYLASSLGHHGRNSVGIELPGRFVLYVGVRTGYKNFRLFVEALSPFCRDEDLYVVCTGGSNFTKQERSLFADLGMEAHILHVEAFDDDLVSLYESALCLVYPSLYEGFGLPILEAFECGCPVLASNTSSIPEVAGQAALLFDPLDVESIKRAVDHILRDAEFRRHLSHEGEMRARMFTWQKTADQTLQTYSKVLSASL